MLEKNPLWYKDAIIYELHVRAFHDHIGDGKGDFRGLTQKLDYLADLGITAVWLLPFYPSPLRDDGYDISDYMTIHPDYGTLKDFTDFLEAAHQRHLRVITELVINHTSDQHPWFQRARRSPPGSIERDFYVWSDNPQKFEEARIIFKDFEQSNWAWDPVARAYYWHRFYSHQPDLNYDNPAVSEAIFPVVDFWLNLGVDGMRLDAVPYLVEREGTSCENLPETHAVLKALRKHVDSKFSDRMLLAEANQWPEDAVAYFGDGDEAHMAFHFPLMPRMFMAVHMENRFPILDIMAQTPAIPENCQWGIFLRNHDELTLEMVTDEERDYMYRAYALDQRARVNLGIRRRLAPLLGNNRRRIELLNGLLLSLPGTPVLYYGDEIGMGDNFYLGDRNAVRTPMQWNADQNAGFSRANPQKLFLPVIIDPEYHYGAVNVQAQQNNPSSLLWWMKRIIALRKSHAAFGRGSLQFLNPENRRILAYLRRYQDETLLVVANLSRFAQSVELDLAEFAGLIPIEMFGRTPFQQITGQPYAMTLGPHSFFWFSLESQHVTEFTSPTVDEEEKLPRIRLSGSWEDLFQSQKSKIQQVLPQFIRQRRWFGGKARTIKSTSIREAIRISFQQTAAYLCLIEVDFVDTAAETYAVPLTFLPVGAAKTLPYGVVAFLHGETEGWLCDALGMPEFCQVVLKEIEASRTLEAPRGGQLRGLKLAPLAECLRDYPESTVPSLNRSEQGNTSILYGNHLILKVFRRLDEGTNPDLEIGRYLSEKKAFPHTAQLLGAIEYRRRRHAEPMTLAVLHRYVVNEGDAWQFTLDALSRYFEAVLAIHPEPLRTEPLAGSPLDWVDQPVPDLAAELINAYLRSAALLGERTADMHLALASEIEDPDFIPEPFTPLYQRSIYQSMRSLKSETLEVLKRRLKDLPETIRPDAQQVLLREAEILQRYQSVLNLKIKTVRTRCHGDYHLGQVLYTGKDFVIIDFEGEPVRSISDRRIKRSPLRDVAGMVRSFHYAAYSALFGHANGRGQPIGLIRSEDLAHLEPWARFWYGWVSAQFLKGYLTRAENTPFIPASREQQRVLFEAFLLDKAIYELGYELNHRPTWVSIPLHGILDLLAIDVNTDN